MGLKKTFHLLFAIKGGKEKNGDFQHLIGHFKIQHYQNIVLKAYEDACNMKKLPWWLINAKGWPEITQWLMVDNQPLTIIEDKSFCRLVVHLEPRFVLPNHCYFLHVCLPTRYNVMATHNCITLIGGNKDISFNMICRRDVTPASFQSLTLQWLD